MNNDQAHETVPTCPKCGEPCTFETTIGVRYCANAHAWTAPDYPRVGGSAGRTQEADSNA